MSSKEYSWAPLRESAAEAFGGRYPDAALEGEIVEAFQLRPAFVTDAIADVVNGYKAGRIHSPWPFLLKRVQGAPVDAVVTDEGDRDGAVKRAEIWLRNAGLHLDRESEVMDELFGDRGMVRHWRDDDALAEHLLDVWRTQRVIGEQVEQEALDRAAEHLATRARLAEQLEVKRAEVEAALSE